MPPKKSKASKAKAKDEEPPLAAEEDPKEEAGEAKPEEAAPETSTEAQDGPSARGDKKASNKRKKADTSDEPQKAPRRSGRGASKSQGSQQQILNFLLSPDATELCRPDDEIEDVKGRGDIQTYSSQGFNPFEELLCAVILSRPISHRLGLRTIRTILNEPYKFSTPQAVIDAGSEKTRQALWDAHTQHKDKTASEISLIADVIAEKFAENASDASMEKLRKDCNFDVEKERQTLKDNIKGLGKTGLDIFFRRMQWQWPKSFPFVDSRSTEGLKKLGLPSDGDGLKQALDEHWSKLDTKNLTGEDEETNKRIAFVMVLERATGSDLEGKSDALLEAAAAA